MRFRVSLALVAAAMMLGVSGATADPTGRFITLTPTAGFVVFDGDIEAPTQSLKDVGYYGGRVGYQWRSWLALEAAAGFASTHENAPDGNKISYWHGSANLVLTPWRGLIGSPFMSFGFGRASLSPQDPSVGFPLYADKPGNLPQGGFEAAIGWTAWVTDRWGVRFEGRDIAWQPKDDLTKPRTHTMVTAVALSYTLGSTPRDTDGDGVPDRRDACASTPKGATVDATGCPKDSDGDGVLDGLDQCANTPVGAKIDARGCPIDSDHDGVFDGLDKCPDTTAGVAVDSTGCPMDFMKREQELLDTGKIRLQNVQFETGKANLKPESRPTLDAVGDLLSHWPQLKIEIGGHTDSKGSAKLNLKLSQARADSVRAYLLSRFPGLKGEQFTTRGYGLSKPIVSNDTEALRALNRRVEFVVLNQGVLQQEIEKRSKPATIPAPTDSTQAPGGGK